MNRVYVAVVMIAVAGEPVGQLAMAEDAGRLSVVAGFEYTSGDYGGSESIEEWYVPVTGKYTVDRMVFRLTIPYLQITAPSGTVVSGGNDVLVIRSGRGPDTTESGLGDVIAGITYRDLLNTEARSELAVDVTGKIKFGTADEDKGLGTGENDYTLQFDLVKYLDRFSPYAAFGYVVRGDPPGLDLDNSSYFVVGGNYRFSAAWSGSIDAYVREASVPGVDDQKELTTALSYRASNTQKLTGYLIRGLDDGSPDWGVGLMATFGY